MVFPGRRAGPDCGAASYDCSTHPVPHYASPLGRPPGTIVQAVIRPALPIAAGVRRMGFSFAGPGPLRENEGRWVSVMLRVAPGGGQAPAARTWRGSNSRSTESRFCRSAASRRPKVFSRSCRSQASASRAYGKIPACCALRSPPTCRTPRASPGPTYYIWRSMNPYNPLNGDPGPFVLCNNSFMS